MRPLGARRWTDADDGSIDTPVPYLVRLPSGRELAAFFSDGEIARAVAFGGLLANGGRFADRLLDGRPRDTSRAHRSPVEVRELKAGSGGGRQLSEGWGGNSATSRRLPPSRRRTRRHRSSGWGPKTSAGRASSTNQSSEATSASSWPGAQPA